MPSKLRTTENGLMSTQIEEKLKTLPAFLRNGSELEDEATGFSPDSVLCLEQKNISFVFLQAMKLAYKTPEG